MELFQLRSFLKVAEEGNITRAAELLYLTQPAVTQQIRALERELGAELFDRTGRGMQLTEAGEALREHAQRSLAILDESQLVIQDLKSGESGKLVLGAGVTTSIFRLPQWLSAYQEKHPKVDVVVRTGRSAEVVQMVLEREIDLGLVTSAVEQAGLVTEALFDEEIVLVAPPNHPLSDCISINELANAPLILFPPASGFRSYLDKTLMDAGVVGNVKMETDSVEAIKSFVSVGLGISFLPLSAVEAEISSGQLVQIKVDNLPRLVRTTSVIYRKDRYLSTAARKFLDVLR